MNQHLTSVQCCFHTLVLHTAPFWQSTNEPPAVCLAAIWPSWLSTMHSLCLCCNPHRLACPEGYSLMLCDDGGRWTEKHNKPSVSVSAGLELDEAHPLYLPACQMGVSAEQTCACQMGVSVKRTCAVQGPPHSLTGLPRYGQQQPRVSIWASAGRVG